MTLAKNNIIWTLYNFYLGTKIYKMYMSTISHNQTSNSEDQFNTISHSKISHVFVWQTLGALKGYMWSECWWVQGLCWLFILSDCTCASKPSENPGHVFSCAKPPWQSQTPPLNIVQDGQYILLFTELICPIHQIISVIDIQSLGNRIFTAIEISKGATKPNMHGVSLSIFTCDMIE